MKSREVLEKQLTELELDRDRWRARARAAERTAEHAIRPEGLFNPADLARSPDQVELDELMDEAWERVAELLAQGRTVYLVDSTRTLGVIVPAPASDNPIAPQGATRFSLLEVD